MLKVIPICEAADIPKMLREMADKVESGEYECDRVTAIAGKNVFCFGPINQDRAAEQAIFDMTWGIHWMMAHPARVYLDAEDI